MDTKNRYHTADTYLHVRLEHVAVVVVCSILALMHIDQLNWWRFIGAFVIIDIIGYLPGAIAYRRGSDKRISPIYHHLYNTMHSYLTCSLIVGMWALAIDGFEWAMMAVPIHLSGDRGVFGNFFKPTALYFEPTACPAPEGMKQANQVE